MLFIDVLVALIVGLFLTLLFTMAFRTKGPWGNVFLFFLLVSLTAWAGGLWLYPFGPTIYDVNWVPFLIPGLLIAILLAAVTPIKDERDRSVVTESTTTESAIVLGWFFWALILGFLATIGVHYII